MSPNEFNLKNKNNLLTLNQLKPNGHVLHLNCKPHNSDFLIFKNVLALLVPPPCAFKSIRLGTPFRFVRHKI